MTEENLHNKFMIDFESFGNSKNACVVQIGAVSFDLIHKLKININGESCIRNGATMDYSTVAWWMMQSEEARASVLAPPLLEESDAFSQLNCFLAGADEIWSHATFDFVILMETLRRLGLTPKFGYRSARDIRTLQSLSKDTTKRERKGTHHDGLDDAIFQVEYCLPLIRKMAALTSSDPSRYQTISEG